MNLRLPSPTSKRIKHPPSEANKPSACLQKLRTQRDEKEKRLISLVLPGRQLLQRSSSSAAEPRRDNARGGGRGWKKRGETASPAGVLSDLCGSTRLRGEREEEGEPSYRPLVGQMLYSAVSGMSRPSRLKRSLRGPLRKAR
jgi:hypothetical protein